MSKEEYAKKLEILKRLAHEQWGSLLNCVMNYLLTKGYTNIGISTEKPNAIIAKDKDGSDITITLEDVIEDIIQFADEHKARVLLE